jgi:hypothetical protein
MNLFRVLNLMRKDEEYVARGKLMSRLADKQSFTEEELNEVYAYRRMEPHGNPDAQRITQKAFATPSLEEKFKLLRKLKGAGMMTASAILALQNPHIFAELDLACWNSLKSNFGFGGADKDKNSDFGLQEYVAYVDALKSLSDEYGMNVSDVQYVLSHTQ